MTKDHLLISHITCCDTVCRQTPFVLLYLNRDDDCFCFIRHWLEHFYDELHHLEQPDLTSRPGDWLYGHQDDCRFQDMAKFFPGKDFPKSATYCLAFLVALMAIKMRILAQNESRTAMMEVFAKTRLGDRLPKIIRSYIGTFHTYSAACIADQERQLASLLKHIHGNNPTMLPSLVNPGPLKNQPPPQYEMAGKPSEAWKVLNESSRVVARIPGAHKRIESIVGKNPVYNADVASMTF